MPSAIPDRFRLEIRLGRDDDVEEWLATDTSLDRPVLIRTLGPETSAQRRHQFQSAVSQIAAVSHPHLAKVYMVEQVEGGAYAVLEWTGGSTLADHVSVEANLSLAEFLPNASGLAGALAALHEHGIAHGAIDPSSITYSIAHPAKLAAFGRIPRHGLEGDVVALAGSLETALTGLPPGGPPPSERIDGITPTIDHILRSAQSGELDARAMEKALSGAPTPRVPTPGPAAGSRKLIYIALGLIAIAVGLVLIGLFFSGGSNEPVLPTQPTSTTTTSPPSTTTAPVGQVNILTAMAFDPYGETPADDPSVNLAVDGDPDTLWRTELFPVPLEETKPGLGIAVSVSGTPVRIQLLDMTPGTAFEIRWASVPLPDPDSWETIARALASPGATAVSLPARTDGHWLIWITSLPADGSGTYRSSIAEVRFFP